MMIFSSALESLSEDPRRFQEGFKRPPRGPKRAPRSRDEAAQWRLVGAIFSRNQNLANRFPEVGLGTIQSPSFAKNWRFSTRCSSCLEEGPNPITCRQRSLPLQPKRRMRLEPSGTTTEEGRVCEHMPSTASLPPCDHRLRVILQQQTQNAQGV